MACGLVERGARPRFLRAEPCAVDPKSHAWFARTEACVRLHVVSWPNVRPARVRASRSMDASLQNTESDVAFVLELGRVLQRYGIPCRRIEQILALSAARMQMRIEVFATVTA